MLNTHPDAIMRERPMRVAKNSQTSICPFDARAKPPAVVIALPNRMPGFVSKQLSKDYYSS